jgi:hypothetical protein
MQEASVGRGVIMKRVTGSRLALAAAFVVAALAPAKARADVVVHIDKSSHAIR